MPGTGPSRTDVALLSMEEAAVALGSDKHTPSRTTDRNSYCRRRTGGLREDGLRFFAATVVVVVMMRRSSSDSSSSSSDSI